MNYDLAEKSSEKYIKVLFLSSMISHVIGLLLVIALLVLTLVFDWTKIPLYCCSALLLVSFIIFNLIVPKIQYARFSFEISEDQVQIKSGIIWREVVLIPMVRIQHVQYKAGPLLRKQGLATIEISTAANQHQIPGLVESYARQLKDKIGEFAKVEESYEQ